MIFDNLPAELRETGLFCVRRGKIPYNPNPKNGGKKAKPNNPGTFTDYHTALAALTEHNFDGLGIGIFGDLVAIDLDHCIRADGTITPDAEHIIGIMDAYTEISPSGTGIRIIAKATGFQFDAKKYRINNGQGKEVYVAGATNRYVTVTGDTLRHRDLVERGTELQEVLDLYMLRAEPNQPEVTPNLPLPGGASVLTDAEVVEKVSAKYPALWAGNTDAYGGDESAADLALMNYLAFYCGRDGEQMDRVFRQSGLMRDKWAKRGDYRTFTISKAVSDCTTVYDPQHRSQLQLASAAADFGEDALAAEWVAPAPDAQPAAPLRFELNEVGNANLLIANYGHKIRYAKERAAWLHWDERGWQWDAGNTVVSELAINTIVTMDTRENKLLAKHRQKSQTYRQITAMLNLAKVHPKIAVSVNDLDAHPYKLNAPNGTIDLTTGGLLPHDRAELHTMSTTAEYEIEQPTPRWLQFLDETFGGDQEMVDYVQRLAGYSAVGEVTHHVLPFLYGSGANGKSVFLEVLRRTLGTYATTAPSGFLMAQKHKEHSTELADLFKRRLVIASEVNEDDRFDEQKTKELSGGDAIKARFMRQDFFMFTPSHTLWLMGNNLPKVRTGGESFWRRTRLIPFTNTVPKEKRDPKLAQTLMAEEGSGILAWVVAGAKNVLAAGSLDDPESVLAATRQYAEEEDTFGRFATDKMRVTGISALRVEQPDLWRAYEKWCSDNGEMPLTKNSFGRLLSNRYPQIGKTKSGTKRYYTGVDLWPDDDDDPTTERWDLA